ncbi:MAG: hypothetical protein ACK4HE_03945 [Chitinophagaceae bacterium]
MKFLIALLLCLPILSFEQNINYTSGKGSKNIYNDALSHFITIIQKQDKKYLDTLFIERDFFYYPDDITETVHGVRTKILGWAEINELLEPERPFLFVRFLPLGFDKGKFYVIISVSRIVRRAGKKYNFENGVVLYYSFDCNKKNFKYSSFEILNTIEFKGTLDY